MSYPATYDTFSGTATQGTTLLTSIDHAGDHRLLGSALGSVEAVLGTTLGTNVFRNIVNASDQVFALNTGGTANQTVTKGTANSMVFGTPAITGGSATNATFINGTIQGTNTQIITRIVGAATVSPAGGATGTLDLSTAIRFLVNMPNAGTVTLALSNGVANQIFFVECLQGTSGNGTVGWFSTITWAGGTALVLGTTANYKDTAGFVAKTANTYDGYVVGTAIR